MELGRKISILLVTSLFVLLMVMSLIMIRAAQEPQKDPTETQVQTFNHQTQITMDSRKMVSAPQLLAPYKTMDVFISEEEEADFKFTSAGASWEQYMPDGTNVDGEVRFNIDGEWSDWLDLDEEIEWEDGDNYKEYATASTNPADSLQYRFTMYGDGDNSPIIKNLEWTFIRAGKLVSASATPIPRYSSSEYIALAADKSGAISRNRWGANESYRYMGDNYTEPELVALSDDFYETYADELGYSRVVEEDSKGDKYKWPLQYPEEVKKFIIHHTATTKTLDDPAQAIRDIYYYHSVSRGWGDIGYNYIVDPNGKVYEGRYGGEGVIGAHAGSGNHGSIGIAVLGNYEENEVPAKVVAGLSKLISAKAKIHGIDPDGKSIFRGKKTYNVLGHSDFMSTACPGANLYAKLPIVRELAASVQEEKEKFITDYAYEDESDTYYVELSPSETKEITIKMENTGKVTWNSNTFIVVNQNPEFDGVISFPTKSGVKLAMMQESSVKPGKTATFKFKIKAGKSGNTVYMDIAPLVNGSKKISDYIVLPVTVEQSNFKYKYKNSSFPETASAGEEFAGWVKLENTGNTTWRKNGENTVKIGADHERDRKSLFVSPPSSRFATLEEDEVAPGETGRFNFQLEAPATAGYYKEYFTPVIEGQTWMKDSGMYFETTIYGGKYSAEYVSQSGLDDWKRGKGYIIWIKIRNLGNETWKKGNFKVMTLQERDLKVSSAMLVNDEVKPGHVGTVQFTARVSDTEDLEKKAVLVRPTYNGEHLLPRPIYFYYTVSNGTKAPVVRAATSEKSTDISESEKDIRIKLSYSGNPEITANDDFYIYLGDTKFKSLDKGDTAKVELKNGKYQVTVDGRVFTKSGPIRFVPKDDSIFEIENYDHSPAWDTSLNDNRYRGVLEVREDGSSLIVINELPLEDYLKGLGEVSNYEETEKIKAIIVAARSYARYYITEAEKFEGKPYHLDDDPNTSQRYLGYGFEVRGPLVAAGVEATRGEVATYDGELIKTPYFNQSDGTQTKSALSQWNWDAPYLVSVSDEACDGDAFYGHGVGMSGCGAKGMAENEYSYLDILLHYYTGIEIADLY